LFVPPHVLANIARANARESLEPTSAQRSATISDRFRRARRNFTPDGTVLTAALAEPKAVPAGLTVPQPGTAGRLIYDDLNQAAFDVKLVGGEGDPAVPGENANRAYDYLAWSGTSTKRSWAGTRSTTRASTSLPTSITTLVSTTLSLMAAGWSSATATTSSSRI